MVGFLAGRRHVVIEAHYEHPPADVWRVISDTNRGNEASGGVAPYTVEDVEQPDGSVVRHGKGRMGPVTAEWTEGFGEWVEGSYVGQARYYTKGPARSLIAVFHVAADGDGSKVTYEFDVVWDSWLGRVFDWFGAWTKVPAGLVEIAGKRIAALEGFVAAPAPPPAALSAAQQQRFDGLIGKIEDGPYGRGLARRLGNYLIKGSMLDVRRIRPLALARTWDVPEGEAIDLCIAAQAAGLLDMRWAVLCPRCRVGKAQVGNLYELPQGVHCESCNIDYERDFSANVELVFSPASWLRDIEDGDFCFMGSASAPHVKVQRTVEPGAALTVPLVLEPGHYRLRTVEAGGQWDVEHEGGGFPDVVARGTEVQAGRVGEPGTVTLRNDSDRVLNLVIEELEWTRDALTGTQVVAMPVFRDLCPEQVLRPGDEVAIGRVTIMFSDLKGSTALYERVGDSAAYGLVRDHFAFFAERVRAHRGTLVKTIGDSVMAAFNDPADGVRAALAVQGDVGAFNKAQETAAIVVKLGLHGGECIAVNTADTLDYFGTTVNLAARLQGESRGDDIVVSEALAADPVVADVLAGHVLEKETALLHGLAEPVSYYRVTTGRLTTVGDG